MPVLVYKKRARKAHSHIEDDHQAALFNWAKYVFVLIPSGERKRLFDVMYAIPNGGKRNEKEAARLKRQGVKAGVSDVHLIVPVNGKTGLWIELKKPIVKGEQKPRTQKSQTDWLETATACGGAGLVVYGVDEAKQAIKDYLGALLTDPRQERLA